MSVVFGADITYDEKLTTPRKHSKAKKEAYRREALFHRNKRIGKHFKEIPETEPGGAYGYEARDPQYLRLKQRQVGHQIPNVRFGKLRRTIGNTSRVTATQKGSKFFARAYFALTAQRRAELEAISPQEQRESVQHIRAFYRGEVKALGTRKRKRRIRG